MPLVSPFSTDPLIDGRQSERAMMVRRGVQRLMMARRVSLLPEMPLDSGRRADLVCLSDKGEISIVEIKTSIQDFRVDQKWPIYRLHCDRFYFATHPGVPADIFPEDFGLILSDGYEAEVLREAPIERLQPATRRAMTLRFAQLSADRLLQAEWASNPAVIDGS
ncbi:MmcB family DNA repair protein [Jiella marina]|uniref:MmcB family DNA repair protein n=1 Tax=Jiella sp. LLJ827 TaxID=2917712 RepID=UPI0021010A0C|nr:MmcB family DNA repair protein [Jiella sp. LLJ827]MCQ0988534.1 MmcB family DNA repair protein [Jiella sp. LLJ827]